MSKKKHIFDVLTDKRKEEAVEKLQRYFEEEFDEQMGIIAAQDILEVIMRSVSADIYNQGVSDAKEATRERISDLQVDLDVLLKK